jgi:hypothetical protein
MNIRKFILIFFLIITIPSELMAKMVIVDDATATPVSPGHPNNNFTLSWRVVNVTVPGTFSSDAIYFGVAEGVCEIGSTPCPPADPRPNFGDDTQQYIKLPTGCHDWNCAADAFVASKGMSGAVVGMLYLAGRLGYTCVTATSSEGTGAATKVYNAPGSCKLFLDQPTVSCSIPNVATLDHGIMDLSQVDGHASTTNMTVNCNGVAAVDFRLMNDVIPVSSGVTSTLTIDNYTPGSVVSVNTSQNFTLRSVLTGSSPATGPLNGASIVILDVQ